MGNFFSTLGDLGKGLAKVGSFGLLDLDKDKAEQNISESSLLSPQDEEEKKKKKQKEIEQSVLANQTGFRQSSVLTRF